MPSQPAARPGARSSLVAAALVASLAVAAVAALPASAASRKKVCRQRCAATVAACVSAGSAPRRCRRQVLKACRTRGVHAVCVPPVAAPVSPAPAAGPGAVRATVTDAFAAPLAGVGVTVRAAGRVAQATTGASGTVDLGDLPEGLATVRAARAGFVEGEQAVTIRGGQTAAVAVALQPESLPSAATARVAVLGGEGTPAIDFEVDVYAVAADGAELPLGAGDVAVEPFETDTAGTIATTSLGVTRVAGAARGPVSATMLLDQSGSIDGTDPNDSRIQAAKIFLAAMGPGDHALLSAFASGNAHLGGEVVSWGTFTADGRSYFATLDGLADAVDGGTPLYQAAFRMLGHTASTAPTANRALVLFTDGQDTEGGRTLDDVVGEATRLAIPVFAVALGDGTDPSVLAEMAAGTSGAFFWASDARQLVSIYRTLGNLLRGTAAATRTRWRMTRTAGAFRHGSWVRTSVRVATPAGPLYAPFYLEVP